MDETNKMKKLFRDIFTDGTNVTVDFTKVLGAIAFGVFLFLSILNYGFKGSTWDPMLWTSAVGILLGAVGGVSKVRDFTQPKPTDENQPK